MSLPLLERLPGERSDLPAHHAPESIRHLEVWETGALVQLDINVWTCTVQLEPHDLGLSEVPELYRLGRRLLAPRQLLRPVHSAVQRAYRVLRNLTVAFPVGQARFCPLTALPRLLDDLEECREEFNRACSEFVAAYGSIFPVMREEYEKAARSAYRVACASGLASCSEEEWVAGYLRRMEFSYPHPSKVARKFSMRWTVFRITAPELRPFTEDAGSALAASLAEEIRSMYRERIEAFIESAAREIRTRVAEACRQASEAIARSRTVTEHTLSSLRRMIRDFRMINFVEDREIHDLLTDLENRYLSAGARVLRELNCTEELRRVLDHVCNTALDEAGISRVTGELRRRFIL